MVLVQFCSVWRFEDAGDLNAPTCTGSASFAFWLPFFFVSLQSYPVHSHRSCQTHSDHMVLWNVPCQFTLNSITRRFRAEVSTGRISFFVNQPTALKHWRQMACWFKADVYVITAVLCITGCTNPIIRPPNRCVPQGQIFNCTETWGHPGDPRYAFYYWQDNGNNMRVDGPSYQVSRPGDFYLVCTTTYTAAICTPCTATCFANYTGMVYGECDNSVDIYTNNVIV